jgi:hypothetical protein
MDGGGAHAGLKAGAEIDAQPVRRLMVQCGLKSLPGVHGFSNFLKMTAQPRSREKWELALCVLCSNLRR